MEVPTSDEAEQRRRELTERAQYHVDVQRRRSDEESAKVHVLLDRFVEGARGRRAWRPRN